ncbi:hypothetical protein GOB93_15945 [Acetobacter musti]|mgnify:CR=1 FL=1|uniref:Uncharacterized protein n=1 Tax=Acetobacter musti TaxID=864732 RepID=A0ABX0JW97_9PROT|nr:hypothetical protein [Acetobacter musti]NHN86122.1 hypothetical protein [Acetobacter musti]
MRSLFSKALLGATILIAAPALTISSAAPASAAHHHDHAKSKTGASKETGEATTDDLNAKSLAAAQQDKVPSMSPDAMPGMPAPPGMSMPTGKMPTVTAPTVSVPAAGTGVVAPAAPAAPTTTVPANAPTGD